MHTRKLAFIQLESRDLLSAGCVIPPYDLDGNGKIEPLDALVGIEDINKHGGARLLDQMSGRVTDLYDPNFNGWRDQQDVLYVVNFLNANGAQPVVYDCESAFLVNYNKITDDGSLSGDIVVPPGATGVHVVSAFIGAKDRIGFLEQVNLAPYVTDFAVLNVNGQTVATSSNGVFDLSSNPVTLYEGKGVTLDVYANMPKQDGGYLFSLEKEVINVFTGSTAVVHESNLNNRRVVTVRPKEPSIGLPALTVPADKVVSTEHDVLLYNMEFSGKENPPLKSGWFAVTLSGGNLASGMPTSIRGIHLELPDGTRIDPSYMNPDNRAYDENHQMVFSYDGRFDNLPGASQETWGMYADQVFGAGDLQDVVLQARIGNYADPSSMEFGMRRPVAITNPQPISPEVIVLPGSITNIFNANLGYVAWTDLEQAPRESVEVILRGPNVTNLFSQSAYGVHYVIPDGTAIYSNHQDSWFVVDGGVPELHTYFVFNNLPSVTQGFAWKVVGDVGLGQNLTDASVRIVLHDTNMFDATVAYGSWIPITAG